MHIIYSVKCLRKIVSYGKILLIYVVLLLFGSGCLTVYLNFDPFFECNGVDEGARCLKSEAVSNG